VYYLLKFNHFMDKWSDSMILPLMLAFVVVLLIWLIREDLRGEDLG
jgi:hypothetical protein